MGIYAFNTNRNLTKRSHKQRFVPFTKGTGRIQKRVLDKPLITPQVKLGKNDNEILNDLITELQYSMQYNKFK